MSEEIYKNSGDVLINQLTVYAPSRGKFLHVTDYLVELNIFESIFSPVITGTLTVTDSRNIIKDFPLIGEEYLYINFKTPAFKPEDNFAKLFRIYSISDKNYSSDGTSSVYQLSFSSIEAFNNLNNPIYKSFEGKPEDIIKEIYDSYLASPRNIYFANSGVEEKVSPFTILTPTANRIKFISPGWTAFECINWICSKSLPVNNTAANFLFWETNTGFYFGSTETIFKNNEIFNMGNYVYSQALINNTSRDETYKKLFGIKSMNIEKTLDQMTNVMSGYLSNRVLNIDLYNKQYENIDYDHASGFDGFSNTERGKTVPLFDQSISRNPLSFLTMNYSHDKLYNNMPNNFDVETKNIFGNRRATLLELDNFKMNLVIPGRSDIQVGSLMYIEVPPGHLITEGEKNENTSDGLYSGNYFITNFCHKINPATHFISMTATKNSFSADIFRKLESDNR